MSKGGSRDGRTEQWGGDGPAPAPRATRLRPGDVVDERYRIESLLGEGGMGSVYVARHVHIGRQVALKVLHAEHCEGRSDRERFRREAAVAVQLRSPHVVEVLDFGEDPRGHAYYAMELLEGESLRSLLERERRLSPERVVKLLRQLLTGLSAAHAAGVVHRDLKPENIMVEKLRSDPDYVKVLDFGIAKIRDFDGSEQSSFKTATGMVFGTPEYMSPEQIRGEELDGRSDLYSLGVVLYQMLTDELPFSGESVLEVATAHLTQPPVPLQDKRSDLPPGLCAVVARMMNKKREDRFPTAGEARRALSESLNGNGAAATPEEDPDVFARTTARVDKPPRATSEAEPKIEPTCVMQSPPKFPTAEGKRLSSFRNLALLLFILVAAAGLTLGVLAIVFK
jgi:serine/threonine-protein kinase